MNDASRTGSPLRRFAYLVGGFGLLLLSQVSSQAKVSLAQIAAAQDTTIPIGGQVKSLTAIAALPDGNYQFCSEPEPPEIHLGAGVCYWFRKMGQDVIGYYGLPNSDIFIDCLRGKIQSEQIIGSALAVVRLDPKDPEPPQTSVKWHTVTLESGEVVHSMGDRFGKLEILTFPKASLTLQDFYRYGPAKVQAMLPPPTSCQVDNWIKKLSSPP